MTIKKGDLVMCKVSDVQPSTKEFAGTIRIVGDAHHRETDHFALVPPTICSDGYKLFWHPIDLKKIDPPSTGETTRAYRGLKETA